MQCQSCNEPATVHLTEIVNGEKIERHLCENCAHKEGITIKTQIPLNQLLNKIVTANEEADELADLSCPHCGLSWSEFRKAGQLGCPNDYLAFERPLKNLIERAQEEASVHIGKIPHKIDGTISDQVQLRKLRKELEHAIGKEDYEKAAQIRDEIKHLE
ncbi:MAG: hypothetical protein GY869_02055 [Planctomycetes bacterium]|nr:hypothetical protein [Planctomycetota bacterium]